MRHSKTRNRGFTLIEVLLVVLILVMLAGVGVFAISSTRDRAKVDTTKLMLKEITSALDTFNMHMGRYPTDDEGLGALRTKPEENEDDPPDAQWSGPYLKKEPKDTWGKPLNYQALDSTSEEYQQGQRYKVWSNGPDGTSETDDDIKSWEEAEAGA